MSSDKRKARENGTMEHRGKNKRGLWIVLAVIAVLLLAIVVRSAPDGVTLTILGNTTKAATAGTIGNFTGNDTSEPDRAGGFIFTMNVTGESQNLRWKAFVGNVSGKLTLDDADGATIYDWDLAAISGEIYATRASTTVNWSGIACNNTNITEHENNVMNHTSLDDNISVTFSNTDNDAIVVGTTLLPSNTCETLNIYLNSTSNTVDSFEEIILFDRNESLNGTNKNYNGNVIYAQILENQQYGYANTSFYDFQMIVPERGSSGWTGATAYYFYVELS